MTRGATVLVLLVLTGCAKPTPPGCDTGVGRAGGGSVLYTAREGHVLAVAWTDLPLAGTSGKLSRVPGRAENTIAVEAGDGRRVELAAVTADGVTWAVSLNGRDYPLVDGAVFLVRTRGGNAQVTQVRRDVSRLPATSEEWDRLAGEIPEVKAFVAEVGGND